MRQTKRHSGLTFKANWGYAWQISKKCMAQLLPQAGPLYFLVATSCSHTARLAGTAEELGQALETKINFK